MLVAQQLLSYDPRNPIYARQIRKTAKPRSHHCKSRTAPRSGMTRTTTAVTTTTTTTTITTTKRRQQRRRVLPQESFMQSFGLLLLRLILFGFLFGLLCILRCQRVLVFVNMSTARLRTTASRPCVELPQTMKQYTPAAFKAYMFINIRKVARVVS